jgi:hypothetical protein
MENPGNIQYFIQRLLSGFTTKVHGGICNHTIE